MQSSKTGVLGYQSRAPNTNPPRVQAGQDLHVSPPRQSGSEKALGWAALNYRQPALTPAPAVATPLHHKHLGHHPTTTHHPPPKINQTRHAPLPIFPSSHNITQTLISINTTPTGVGTARARRRGAQAHCVIEICHVTPPKPTTLRNTRAFIPLTNLSTHLTQQNRLSGTPRPSHPRREYPPRTAPKRGICAAGGLSTPAPSRELESLG